MALSVEVELDILSGMPNPRWPLTDAEADSLAERLAGLPRLPARTLAGNLGYRGLIVHIAAGTETRLIRVQAGGVHITEGAGIVYAGDEGRRLERWLLETGRPHLRPEVFRAAERALR